MKLRFSSLELLESRIAPSSFAGLIVRTNSTTFGAASAPLAAAPASLFQISADGKTATYTSTDGDIVSVIASKGRFRSENFVRTADPDTGRIDVDLLDLTALGLGARFQGADITVNVTTGVGGDGFGDLAGIKAIGIDLGRVVVTKGDLGQIDVGDADVNTPALLLMQATEMGFYGAAGQVAGQDTVSRIRGSVGSIKLSELRQAFIDVRGSIGAITLDAINGAANAATNNASIRASGAIDGVQIKGIAGQQSIEGGDGDYSSVIWSRVRIGAVSVVGNIKGGGGFDSGSIFAGSPDSVTAPIAGRVGPTNLYGSLIGGPGENSGTLYADSGLLAVRVFGSITGGGGRGSGSLQSGLGFVGISILGDLASGTGDNSGSILGFGGGVPNILIAGQIVANNFAKSGIFLNGTLGALHFKSAPGGNGNATEIRARDGIGEINVFGDLNDVFVRAGTNVLGADVNANTVIGTVLIGGNFTGGGLMAGATFGPDNLTFSADDVRISPDPLPLYLSRIDHVIVKGTFTPFAVEAERIGSIVFAGALQNLAAGPRNDNFLIGSTVIKETL